MSITIHIKRYNQYFAEDFLPGIALVFAKIRLESNAEKLFISKMISK